MFSYCLRVFYQAYTTTVVLLHLYICWSLFGLSTFLCFTFLCFLHQFEQDMSRWFLAHFLVLEYQGNLADSRPRWNTFQPDHVIIFLIDDKWGYREIVDSNSQNQPIRGCSSSCYTRRRLSRKVLQALSLFLAVVLPHFFSCFSLFYDYWKPRMG